MLGSISGIGRYEILLAGKRNGASPPCGYMAVYVNNTKPKSSGGCARASVTDCPFGFARVFDPGRIVDGNDGLP